MLDSTSSEADELVAGGKVVLLVLYAVKPCSSMDEDAGNVTPPPPTSAPCEHDLTADLEA